MKTKIEISISVVLMVVILATILSLSFAWFSASNPQVFANNGQFNAAETESANANINLLNIVNYGGETGVDRHRGDLDYPYKAYYTFSISFKPLSSNNCVTNKISSLSIQLNGETEPSIVSDETNNITNNISWDLYLVKPAGETTGGSLGSTPTVDENYSFFPAWILGKEGTDWYYKTGETEPQSAADYEFTHYFPAECFGKDDDIVRDINGNPLELKHLGLTRTYTFVIEITFLDRVSYCAHCSEYGAAGNHPVDCPNKNGSINAFAYSDPSYMNCLFSIGIDVGFEPLSPTSGGGIN